MVVLILGVALWVFGDAARALPRHGDEDDYIEASRYFSFLFVRRDARRPEWGDGRTIHTQGLVPSYLIGAWLWARGYPVEDLYVGTSAEEHAEFQARILRESRAPMVMVGAAASGVLYLLGRALAGPIAGVTMAALATASPLGQSYLGQARSEPAIALFMLLALLLAVVGARRGEEGRLPFGWGLTCGAALGLAIGSKHTAMLSLTALLMWGLLAAAWGASRERAAGAGARLLAAWGRGRGWLLAATVGLAVFVLGNPHFHPDPPRHLWHLVEARQEVVLDHQERFPRRVVESGLPRARMVGGRALNDDTATGSRGVPLEAILAPLGAGVLLLNTVRGARRTGHLPADGLVLVTAAAYFVGVTAGLAVAWERYFLPTLLVSTVLSGVGLAAVVRALPIVSDGLRGRRGRLPQRAAHRAD